MHVKSLKVFCDIVGRRSFSRAADENGISQSGASQIVHQLEESLGVKLIDRSKRPFVLTPEGEVYYDGCRKLVQRFHALEEEVRTLHQDVSGRVNVAAIYSVGLCYMNAFVHQFRQRHPKATVRVQYQHPSRVYEQVATDRAAVGLISYPRSNRAIKATPWRREPMVLVCSPDHPLAQRRSVEANELNGLEMIGFDEDLRIRREIDRVLSAHGVEVDVVMDFDNIETLKTAIQVNSGAGLLPEPTVQRELRAGLLVAVPLSDIEMDRPIGIIQRRGAELGKTARRFLQLLKKQSVHDEPLPTGGSDEQTEEPAPQPATAGDSRYKLAEASSRT